MINNAEFSLVIGADHRGYAYKEYIKHAFPAVVWIDVGARSTRRSDYPLFSHRACQIMLAGHAQRGVLICGSGVGMAVAANRYPGIYAAVVWNAAIAKISREHDNINMLVIPSDFISQRTALACIKAWLNAEFLGGRYQKRIEMIDAPEDYEQK